MSGTTSSQELAQDAAQPLPSTSLKTSSTSSVNRPSTSTSTQEPTPPSSPARNTDAIQETSCHDARDNLEEDEAEEQATTSSKPAATPALDDNTASSSTSAALAAPSTASMTAAGITPPNTLPQDSTLEQLSTTNPHDVVDESRDADEPNAEPISNTERPVNTNTSELVENLAAVSLDAQIQEQGLSSSTAPVEILQTEEPPKPAGSVEQGGESHEREVEGAEEGEHEEIQGPPDLPEQEQQQADLPARPTPSTQRIEIPDDHPLPQLPEPEEPEHPEIVQRRHEPAPIIASPAEVAPVSISVTNPSPATPRRSPFVQYQYSSLIPREEVTPPPRTSSSRHRQPSVVPLPPWQPDAEAHSCPICGNSFTMFYRRHHCRKCGRVVCAPCSNHKLVMPRAFVVSPPAAPDTVQDQTSNTGAMEVRICEDCMEGRDRNHHHHYNQRPRRRTVDSIDSPAGTGRFWEPEFSSDAEYERRRRRSSAQDISVRSPTSPHHSHSRSHHLPTTHHSTTVSHHRSVSAQIPRTEQMFISRGSPPARSGGYPGASSSRRDAPLPHTPPRPRLKETDYCPICTLPLPPVGDDGDETAREAHILDCIRLAEAAVSPRGGGGGDNRRRTTASANSPPVSYSPLVAPSIPGSGGGVGEISASSSPARSLPSMTDDIEERTRRMNAARVGRMVVYRATEKDTFAFAGDAESSAGGQKAECVICFEEFEVGEAIARLECLCRYHKKCIREWFDRKGNGDCPVHAVHE